MATSSTKQTDRQRHFQPGNQLAKGHGAPRGNTNALRGGRGKAAKSKRRPLTIGRLPKGCSWISTRVSALRRGLEALVTEVDGSVSFKSALSIQSSCRHEMAALLAQRWLKMASETMTHSERLSYLQAVASESDRRDKCIDRLPLTKDATTILSTLYDATITLPEDFTEETTPEPKPPIPQNLPETESDPSPTENQPELS